jgi:hypothetical protein
VQVNDAEDARILVLHRDELHQRAEVVPKVQAAGWLHPREHALRAGVFDPLLVVGFLV